MNARLCATRRALLAGTFALLVACTSAAGRQEPTLTAAEVPSSSTAAVATRADPAPAPSFTATPAAASTATGGEASPLPVTSTAPSVTAAPAASPAAAPVPTATSAAATPAAAATPVTVAPTPAPAPTAAPAVQGPVTTVVVVLTDSAIKPAQASAPAGAVKFAVTNTGTVVHEVVVLKTDLLQNQIPADPTRPVEVQEPGYLGKVALLNPGASASLTLVLPAGNYVLICNQPAHYLVGMHTAFAVN